MSHSYGALATPPPLAVISSAKELVNPHPVPPSVVAVAVAGDRILATGSLDQVIVPGLLAQHDHPLLAGLTMTCEIIAIEHWVLPRGTTRAARNRTEDLPFHANLRRRPRTDHRTVIVHVAVSRPDPVARIQRLRGGSRVASEVMATGTAVLWWKGSCVGMERALAVENRARASDIRWRAPLAVRALRPLAATLAVALLFPHLVACGRKKPEAPAVVAPRQVSALGRVEPESKIRRVSVPSSLSGDRIEKLLVQEDDEVKQGQPLAILNSYGTLKAAFDEANELVAVSRGKLAQVLAGAKQGEIRAQQYQVESLERQLAAEKLTLDQAVTSARAKAQEANLESQRYDKLYSAGGVSELERDRYRTRASTTRAELAKAIEDRAGTEARLRADIESAKQTLDKIKEVRPEDVVTARGELRKAEASRERAQQEFAYATVRAPQDGRILKIFAWPGDKVGDNGLLELADTSNMVVTAEVYQSDMAKLQIGQGATITADGFQGSARATLYRVLPQVQKQSTFAGTPGENMDQRVYEVKLRLHPTAKEQPRLRFASNLQVNVVFDAAALAPAPAPAPAARP